MGEQNDPIFDEAKAAIQGTIVGFVRFRKSGPHNEDEDADIAGSGTLAAVGPMKGVLTAAHVILPIPITDTIGFVEFVTPRGRPQRVTVRVDYLDYVHMGGERESSTGPDLSFIKLPLDTVASLENAGCVFLNLEKYAQAATLPPGPHFDAFLGAIEQRTEDIDRPRKDLLVKLFESSLEIGRILRQFEADGYDLAEFEVDTTTGYQPPTDYGGMSGGAWWRFSANAEDGQAPTLRSKTLLGVVFFQSDIIDGKRTLTAHGPQSVYDTLLPKIRERWP